MVTGVPHAQHFEALSALRMTESSISPRARTGTREAIARSRNNPVSAQQGTVTNTAITRTDS